MATDPVLRMLGLARRAGKLAYGDELVREACFDHKTRCVFIAGDAGANAAKKAAFYADKANVPCVTLPHGKLELGSAIGKAGCAMCAVADIGMAAAAVNKLAEQDPAYAEVAQQLSEKNAKIQSRRGVKKHKDKAERQRKRRSRPKNRQRRSRSAPTVSRPARSVLIGRTMRISVLTVKPTARSVRSVRTVNPVRIARTTERSARTVRKATVRIARTTAISVRSARTANAARTVKAVPASRASTAASAASAIKRNFSRRSAHSNSKA